MVCWVEKIEVDETAVVLARVVVEDHSAGPVVVTERAQLVSGIDCQALSVARY